MKQNIMKYFTSDWHINEDRIGLNEKPNLFFRNFKSIDEQNQAIVDGCLNACIKKEDEFFHLGDVVYKWDNEAENILSYLKEVIPCKWTLLLGNYDTNYNKLAEYFERIIEVDLIEIKGRKYYLNHYPIKCKNFKHHFGITGHIHGLWKVQRNMVNVGVDAWNFRFVDENQIDFIRTACEEHYDENVFPF